MSPIIYIWVVIAVWLILCSISNILFIFILFCW